MNEGLIDIVNDLISTAETELADEVRRVQALKKLNPNEAVEDKILAIIARLSGFKEYKKGLEG